MLEDVPLFSGLNRNKLKVLSRNFTERRFDEGKTIQSEGEMGVAFYLIVEGSVDVKKGKRTIAHLGRGQYFGEMSLLDKQPRSATIVAKEPTSCLLMTAWSFYGLLESDSSIAINVMRELARRLRETNKSLSE